MTDEQILDDILRREGGYVDHPADRGGPTKFGITLRTLEKWRGDPVTAADVKALPESEARAIYRAWYLAPFETADPALKPHLVDMAINHGVPKASALLHRALENRRTRSLAAQLVIERLKFYAAIVRNDPAQAAFLAGWVNRAVEFLP